MLSLGVTKEALIVFFVLFWGVLLVKPFLPVPEDFDKPNVDGFAYFPEVLLSFQFLVLFIQDHFHFLFSKNRVVSQLGLNHFFPFFYKMNYLSLLIELPVFRIQGFEVFLFLELPEEVLIKSFHVDLGVIFVYFLHSQEPSIPSIK